MSAILHQVRGSSEERGGFALPAAIFVLVVLGVLVTGGMFVSRQESRIGFSQEQATRALYTAETALAEVQQGWRTSRMVKLPLWGDSLITGSTPDGEWSVTVTRTSDVMFFLDATAELTRGGTLAGANRRIGMMARVLTLELEVPGALMTHGGPGFAGQPPRVSGIDVVPPAWEAAGMCTGPLEDKTGITTDDASGITGSGSGKGKGKGGGGGGDGCPGWVSGAPCVDEDPAVDQELESIFDDEAWDELVSKATLSLSGGNYRPGPSISGGVCATGAQENWGSPFDPTGPCGSYFPIIHVTGDLRLVGNGNGQGILLVDGDLTAVGTFDFFGIILVRGTTELKGTPQVWGGIITDETGKIAGTADLDYSSCVVERAILENDALTRLHPLRERSWVDMTNLAF